MTDVSLIEPLNDVERTELARRESSIAQSLETAKNAFLVAKTELLEIHKQGLFREYGDFKAYVRKRWRNRQVSDSRNRQIWGALESVLSLPDTTGNTITNERQARALNQFPEPYRPTILDTAKSTAETLNKSLSGGLITRVGEKIVNAAQYGTADGSNPLIASIIEDEYEAVQRQKQHMADNSKFEKVISFQPGVVVTDETIRVPGLKLTAGEVVLVSVFVERLEVKAA